MKDLKETYHFLFNKINNISVAAESNKKMLEEELLKLSSGELKEKFSHLIEVLNRITENARALDENLKLLYKSA